MSSTWPVNIGEAARRTSLSAKQIRHCESLGLLAPVNRSDAGYRQYTRSDVHTLQFVHRARELGFSMAEVQALVGLWQRPGRTSAEVRQLVQTHVDDLGERIARMQALQRSLLSLMACCRGNEQPECPILDDLAGQRP